MKHRIMVVFTVVDLHIALGGRLESRVTTLVYGTHRGHHL